ncbi:Major facilitator superfamily and Major facilitator superfamily domain, general substrate transporter and Major facilitator superfamily domain-containing protein [Strongyloides ratti]|uniref:Major facilitator superfamily and Major facilitator superfamily domain, general substrate transporter and Major facilitator superfamily domain-containing protein n=1 Tax=Strongyloides ratti TaxID=34506 RepID=A0A090KV90_STRRB|nr:Major facilitator superfamily and Major facilitator superfamily domain, general substrate transporter and Major facilitator superfamily domain-containing protein [Strongyloides ratti]CEF61435.1 Major facilitator superfamily and Major facilitator superfamily domain, general substrate transporter and Major facilitator superfamily domain-containing protein [Strongyloides ratti]
MDSNNVNNESNNIGDLKNDNLSENKNISKVMSLDKEEKNGNSSDMMSNSNEFNKEKQITSLDNIKDSKKKPLSSNISSLDEKLDNVLNLKNNSISTEIEKINENDSASYNESCCDIHSESMSELNLDECIDEMNDEPLCNFVPTPPDGGYGWVICIVAFISNLIVDGISSSFGTLVETFQKAFGSSKAMTTLIGSLLVGSYLLVGPIVGGLVNKYGARTVVICGSLISAFGFFISTFTTNIYVFLLTFSLIGGIGFGHIYLPSIVMVGYYFESKRAMATGIAVAGSGVGCIIMPPILTMLIKEFGWIGTIYGISGMVLICIICGMLYKELYTEIDNKCGNIEKGNKRIKTLLNKFCGCNFNDKKEHINEVNMTSSYTVDPNNPGKFRLSTNIMSNSSNTNNDYDVPPGVDPELYARLHSAIDDDDDNNDSEEENHENIPLKQSLTPIIEAKVQNKFSSTNASQNNPTCRGRKHTITSIGSEITGIGDNLNISKMSNSIYKVSARSLYQSFGRLSQATNNVSIGNSIGSIALSIADAKEIKRPLNRKDIFYTGSIQNLKEFDDEGRDFKNYRESQIHIPASSIAASLNHLTMDENNSGMDSRFGSRFSKNTYGLGGEEIDQTSFTDNSKFKIIPLSIRNAFNEMIDIQLLTNSTMLLLFISNMLAMLGFYVPFVYLINLAELRGSSKETSSLFLSIMGISNTLGRVITGWIADKPWCVALTFNNASLVIGGILLFLMPLTTGFYGLMTITILYGFVVSVYVCLTSIVLTDLIGLEKLTNSFGLIVVARGIASLMGTPFAGIFYDLTQTYDSTFYMGGTFIIGSGLVSCIIPFVKKVPHKENIIIDNKNEVKEDDDGQSGKLSVLTERSEENFSEYQRTIQSLHQQQQLIAEVRKLEKNKIDETNNEEE